MNSLFRIVQKRTNKRIDCGSPYRDALTILLFVFLLPYVISCLWGHVGEEAEAFFHNGAEESEWIDEKYGMTLSGKWGTRKISMQEYLIRKLESVMPDDEDGVTYELETLKAQAVLLRTELYALLLSREGDLVLEDDVSGNYWESIYTQEQETPYETAVYETDGIYLSYEGAPVKAAFFPISNGRTRDAAEAMQNVNYPYLVSVECGQDILAKDFQSQAVFSREEYNRLLGELFGIEELEEEINLTYDSAGYVTTVELSGHDCSGEAFRYMFGLSSASFQMEWQEDVVTFHVKGEGHGFGMSQYGANEKAVSGETFDQILEDYFFQAELAKIE